MAKLNPNASINTNNICGLMRALMNDCLNIRGWALNVSKTNRAPPLLRSYVTQRKCHSSSSSSSLSSISLPVRTSMTPGLSACALPFSAAFALFDFERSCFVESDFALRWTVTYGTPHINSHTLHHLILRRNYDRMRLAAAVVDPHLP